MNTWPNRGASGGPCGGLEGEKTEQPKQSDYVGLTQANRPPRNPVRFNQSRLSAIGLTPPVHRSGSWFCP